jgi:hypothetical protein
MRDGTEASTSAHVPVFASVPTLLDEDQSASKKFVYWHLRRLLLEPRTVGASDYGHFNPLHEVRTLARHCAGGIILGYQQISAARAVGRKGTIRPYTAPTPWNHLETGILFGLGLPLLVLKEANITGGIFDEGSSDIFVHDMPMPGTRWDAARPETYAGDQSVQQRFEQAVVRWQGLVRGHYYQDE